jgi:membrane protein implicated in regulation of membrane protease activity
MVTSPLPSLVLLQFSPGPETLALLLVVAGLGLTVAEAFAPGAHFVVLGVALLAAGLVGLLLGPFAGPIVLGVLVLVFGAMALYAYREFDFYGGKGTGQTTDSSSLRGKTGRVTERVTRSAGEIKLDDGGGFNPYYAARTVGGEIPEGSEVMVVDPGGGNVVTVEAVDGGEDEIDRALERERVRRETEGDDGETEKEKET